MRGQLGSVDAVISLSVLAAMLAMWAHLFQDVSPVLQMYTYKSTSIYADHVASKLLYDISAPWICRTPNNIPIPGCVLKNATISAADLDLNDLNVLCSLTCTPPVNFTHPCNDTYTPAANAPPVFTVNIRMCDGDWNACTLHDCVLEVWHK